MILCISSFCDYAVPLLLLGFILWGIAQMLRVASNDARELEEEHEACLKDSQDELETAVTIYNNAKRNHQQNN